MRKVLTCLTAALLLCLCARAQEVDLQKEFFSLPDTITNEYLDTVQVQKIQPNNYWLVGVYGGAAFNYGYFNPTRYVRWQANYPMFGFSFVRYYTMFGLFPYLGMEFGAQLNYEGYEFKMNKETGAYPVEYETGTYKMTMQVPEIFFLTHAHLDMGDYFKLMLKVGLYGGYRLKIHRILRSDYAAIDTYQANVDSFMDFDRRWTYGLQGGLGAGVMLGRFEVHLTAQVKWGWESFWNPDYVSPYYYRFGYPLDVGLNLGVYYQLTPRLGHSDSQLRKLAKKLVEEENQR